MPFPTRRFLKWRVRAAAAVIMPIALLASGCVAHVDTPRLTGVRPFGRDSTLIYVPGIGGFVRPDHRWLDGLRAGGFEGKTEVWDWTGKLAPISALWAHTRQRAEARRIAERIRRVRSESPGAPIVLVGHSAGAGVAVMALEDLPTDVRVDELVLMAPAVSRKYDLTNALRHVCGRADVFYSNRDTVVLAIGTFLFGTVDGVHGESAGHAGFVKPRGASDEEYARLVQHPYSNKRRLYGDGGGHQGVLTSGVAAALVAPLLPGHDLDQGRVAQTDAHELP